MQGVLEHFIMAASIMRVPNKARYENKGSTLAALLNIARAKSAYFSTKAFSITK